MKGGCPMGNELTMADMALIQAAIDEANASMGRALAVIENAAARLGASPCRGCDPADDDGACAGCRRAVAAEPCGECQGEDFGDCASCRDVPVSAGNYEWNAEPEGRVYGGGGHGQDS